MIIILDFEDGNKREYNILESLNEDIMNGLVATIKFTHPKYAEYFSIEIEKENYQ